MKNKKKNAIYLIITLINSILFYGIYAILVQYSFWKTVTIVYLALIAAVGLSYTIYNRFFVRKGVTEEMLPAEWSEEQKTEFIEDGKRRLKQSRWMIVPIFAFLITFGVDALELFVFPFFRGLFS